MLETRTRHPIRFDCSWVHVGVREGVQLCKQQDRASNVASLNLHDCLHRVLCTRTASCVNRCITDIVHGSNACARYLNDVMHVVEAFINIWNLIGCKMSLGSEASSYDFLSSKNTHTGLGFQSSMCIGESGFAVCYLVAGSAMCRSSFIVLFPGHVFDDW